MAQKKSKGFQDPLDSIFGFIFGNAKSKPVKVRPTKLSGYNASQELARGLAEIASAPANYVGDAAISPVQNMAKSTNLAQFETDKFDDGLNRGLDNSAGRFRITAADLPKVFRDPNKFVDAVFANAKEERTWARYLNAGRGLDTALLAVWAKKQGFSSAEAVKIGAAASNFLGPDQDLESRRGYAQNFVHNYLKSHGNYSNSDLLKVFDELDKYKGGHIASEADLKSVLKRIPSIGSTTGFDDLVKDLYEKYALVKDPKSGQLVQKRDPRDGKIDYLDGKINRHSYLDILRQNYENRALLLDSTNPSQANEQRRLLAARNALDNILKLKGPGFGRLNVSEMSKLTKGVSDEIERIEGIISSSGGTGTQDQIRYVSDLKGYRDLMLREAKKAADSMDRKSSALWGRIGGVGDPIGSLSDFSRFRKILLSNVDFEMRKLQFERIGNPGKDAYYDNLIDSLKTKRASLLSAPMFDYRIGVADLVGTIRSIKGNIGEGKFLQGFLTGGIYKDDILSPGYGQKFRLRSYKYQISTKNGKEDKILNWGGEAILPRTDIHPLYANLAAFYYFTPNSLAKTFFFNGEGFAYALYRQRERLVKNIFTSSFQTQLLAQVSGNTALAAALKGFIKDGQLNTAAIVTDLPAFHAILSSHSGSLGGLWNTIDAFYKKDQNGLLGTATRIFGYPARALTFLQEKYLNRMKDWAAKNMIAVYTKIFGEKLTAKFAGLGVRQAISVIVNELLVALGVATGGPIGFVLATALTALGEGVLYKIVKPVIKLVLLFIWSLVLVIIAFIVIVPTLLFKGAYPSPQGHLPPTDMLQCSDINGFKNVYKYPEPVNAGNFPPAPGGSCPLSADARGCTQGNGAGSSEYHQQYESLDIGTRAVSNPIWYAPTDGDIISYEATSTCDDGANLGGVLVFKDSSGVLYRLIHIAGLATGHVTKGTPVARALGVGELNESYCWHGPHFHLDVQVDGQYVDTQTWYNEKLKCNIQNASGLGCDG